jgi:hypothetical protein
VGRNVTPRQAASLKSARSCSRGLSCPIIVVILSKSSREGVLCIFLDRTSGVHENNAGAHRPQELAQEQVSAFGVHRLSKGRLRVACETQSLTEASREVHFSFVLASLAVFGVDEREV